MANKRYNVMYVSWPMSVVRKQALSEAQVSLLLQPYSLDMYERGVQ